MNRKPKQESGDKEMNQINAELEKYVDKIMKADRYPHTGIRLPKNVPGGTRTLPNFPGGAGIKKKAGGLKEATERLRAQGLKKGGKKKKFPDLSGDGKVTMKDILMGRGIIKKTKKKTKKSKP